MCEVLNSVFQGKGQLEWDLFIYVWTPSTDCCPYFFKVTEFNTHLTHPGLFACNKITSLSVNRCIIIFLESTVFLADLNGTPEKQHPMELCTFDSRLSLCKIGVNGMCLILVTPLSLWAPGSIQPPSSVYTNYIYLYGNLHPDKMLLCQRTYP